MWTATEIYYILMSLLHILEYFCLFTTSSAARSTRFFSSYLPHPTILQKLLAYKSENSNFNVRLLSTCFNSKHIFLLLLRTINKLLLRTINKLLLRTILEKMVPLQGKRALSLYFWSFQKHNREEGGHNKNNRPINLPNVITFSTDYKYTT